MQVATSPSGPSKGTRVPWTTFEELIGLAFDLSLDGAASERIVEAAKEQLSNRQTAHVLNPESNDPQNSHYEWYRKWGKATKLQSHDGGA